MFRRLLLVSMTGLTGLSGLASAQPDRVKISSVVDASQVSDAKQRATNAATVKRVVEKLIARESFPRGDVRHLDISVVNLTVDPLGEHVVVAAEVRITVSGGRGTLLQVFAGGAKVEIPVRSYRAHRLPGLREDALAGAVEAVYGRIKRTLPVRELTLAAR
ncbi:MAG: hypothetical protein H0T42_14760 [Deltaproteobacteria bacterium]|nr:hypothetical protein [Deltaproteobacteria bacterium]